MYFNIRDKLFSFVFKLIYSKKFKKLGSSSHIFFPSRIDHPECISVGLNVHIEHGCQLSVHDLSGELLVSDGVKLGKYNHIYSCNKIVIESNVLTANGVYISVNLHGYKDISVPIMTQDLVIKKAVTISEGAWIGHNVCIIGASIGRNSVVGANSVVLADIPDYCVAVGAPAKVIKRYDLSERVWKNVGE